MIEIPLSQGKIALIDDEDFKLVAKYTWCANFDRKNWYAVNAKYRLRMHRIIMKAKPGQIIDHKDLNTLNNQKHNLRLCTHSQNNSNRKAKKNGSSKYLGVCVAYQKTEGRIYKYYRAGIVHNHKKHFLGLFKDEVKAAEAYNAAAIRLHGKEYSNLNVIKQAPG